MEKRWPHGYLFSDCKIHFTKQLDKERPKKKQFNKYIIMRDLLLGCVDDVGFVGVCRWV